MASVRLDGVRKVYDQGHVAVAGASFEVADGEFMVLVGPSGCGKTTLLRMIAGLEAISAGTLQIDGRTVNDLSPKDRDIAMVFQNYALYPHMSVAENMGFGLRLRGVDRAEIERHVREAATVLELTAVLERKPRQLSGGQQQRVALGRALVRQPQVFLLDEPLSNLDARMRMTMRTELVRLHRRLQATMIYVTHDQLEAMTLGQRIVVMRGGEIQQIDTPMRVYARPANLFVAGFLGSPTMNLLRGRLQVGDEVHLELGDALRVALGPIHALAELCAACAGREIVLGLRPEDLHVIEDAASETAALEATLEVIEPVGSEAYLHLRMGPHELVARVAPDPLPQPGQRLRLGFATDKLHVFDAVSEQRIELGAPRS